MREGGRQDDGLERFWGWQTRLSPRDGAHLLDEGRRVLTTCGWRLRRGRLNFAAVDGRGGGSQSGGAWEGFMVHGDVGPGIGHFWGPNILSSLTLWAAYVRFS